MSIRHVVGITLAVFGAILVPQYAEASLGYTGGDLFLGFRETGGTQDYLVDIGPASNYTTSTAPFTLSIGNIGADLTNIFGAGWNDSSTVFWSITGANLASDTNSNTFYTSKSETTLGQETTPFNRLGNTASGVIVGKLTNVAGEYSSGVDVSSTNSTVGTIQNSGEANYFAGQIGTNGFSLGASVEGNFANGAADTELDLFQLVPSSTAGQPGTYEGSFTISNSGAVSFSNAPVPEPTTYAILGVGAGMMLLARQRRRQTVNA